MPRTKGATSTVAVRLKDLTRVFKEDAVIYISRRQADENHILGEAVKLTEEVLKAGGNQPAIEEVIAVREIE